MNTRDLIFLLAGALIAAVGIGATIYGIGSIAIIALLVLCMTIIVLLLLQRRQLAAVQKRTLEVVRAQNRTHKSLSRSLEKSNTSSRADRSDLSMKKIIGLLSAQQTSMERLNKKFEDYISNRDSIE